MRHYAKVSKIHFVLPSVDCVENRVYLKQIIKSLDIVFSRSKTANLFAVCFKCQISVFLNFQKRTSSLRPYIDISSLIQGVLTSGSEVA